MELWPFEHGEVSENKLGKLEPAALSVSSPRAGLLCRPALQLAGATSHRAGSFIQAAPS